MEGEAAPRPELNPEWQETIRTGVQDSIDNFELLFSPDSKVPGRPFNPVNFSPITITSGEDEREFKELSETEKNFILNEVLGKLGVELGNDQVVAQYVVDAPPGSEWEGVAGVYVFKTDKSEEEGIFLHEIYRSDSSKEYILASQDYRL